MENLDITKIKTIDLDTLDSEHPIFQKQAHNSRTKRYTPIATIDVLQWFMGKGFKIRQISVVNSKSYAGFQKHLIRLFNPNMTYNGFFPEIILINSANGQTGFQVYLGVYRMVCANGLISGKNFFYESIRHTSSIYDKLQVTLDRVHKAVPKLVATVENMQKRDLSQNEIANLAKNVVNNRLSDINELQTIDYKTVLNPLRDADKKTDLWTIFNILQEKLINGGIQYTALNEIETDGIKTLKTVNRKTRYVKNIDKKVKINSHIFDAALDLLKAA